MRNHAGRGHYWLAGVILAATAAMVLTHAAAQDAGRGQAGGGPAGGGRAGGGRATFSLSDPAPVERALRGAIDLHAHQDPDSRGPSYTQQARSLDALDLATRARASGMRGFVIKMHLDQTAGLAYYVRKLHPDLEVFGGMGSNLTTGPKVNPWAITHMTEVKGGWGRIVWMPSWDSENSSRKITTRKPPSFIGVASCGNDPFWVNFPKPCPNGQLLPEVKEAIRVIATAKTRDSDGDLVLATGHNSYDEIKLMVREALSAGVKRIIITHPLLDIVDMHDDQIKEIVSMGPNIYAEFTSQFGNPGAPAANVTRHVNGIRAAGVERAFVSSDTGQLNAAFQPDALANAARRLREQGFTERELDLLFKINPANILGIPPPKE
jgi:hypothetical protein